MDVPVAALVPIVVVWIGYAAFFLTDIARHDVRHLPKWAWALVVVLSVPLGGIVYLYLGRDAEGRT